MTKWKNKLNSLEQPVMMDAPPKPVTAPTIDTWISSAKDIKKTSDDEEFIPTNTQMSDSSGRKRNRTRSTQYKHLSL